MANLSDYLAKNMDKSFAEKPLNEADMAILSQLSYLNLEGIVSSGCIKTTFQDAYKKYTAENRVSKGGAGDLEDLFTKVANSERYKNLKLSHFKQVEDPNTLEQFGAYAIDVSKLHKVVFFRPTNGSLYSWKENFTVAYNPTSKTQDRAVEYFNKLAKTHPLQTFTLCGHSKGGNNAMNAAANANIFNQTKIKQVINFDGPGFNSELHKGITNPQVLAKTVTIIPEGSIVGRLLDHKEKVIVVKTHEKDGVFEHDMNDWQVDDIGFVRSEENKNNYKSDAVDKKIREIFAMYSEDKREMLVDGIFNILGNTGFTELEDVLKEPKKLIRAYFKTDKEERDIVRDAALCILKDRKFMKIIFGKDRKDIQQYAEEESKKDKERQKTKGKDKDKHKHKEGVDINVDTNQNAMEEELAFVYKPEF